MRAVQKAVPGGWFKKAKMGGLLGVFLGEDWKGTNEGLVRKMKVRQYNGERGRLLLTSRCVLRNEQLVREQTVCSSFILPHEWAIYIKVAAPECMEKIMSQYLSPQGMFRMCQRAHIHIYEKFWASTAA